MFAQLLISHWLAVSSTILHPETDATLPPTARWSLERGLAGKQNRPGLPASRAAQAGERYLAVREGAYWYLIRPTRSRYHCQSFLPEASKFLYVAIPLVVMGYLEVSLIHLWISE